MTPGDNGASTPEDDDPFGYLYADGQARGAQPPSGGYGYPNSVSRVRSVGERTYGGQQAQAVPQQQGTYGQPNAHYQAPETLPGGAPTTQQPLPGGGGRGRGSGPNTKGLLIGAVAVVAAVVIGISIAMMNGNSDDDKASGGASTSPTQSQSASPTPSSSVSSSGELPKIDAKALLLEGGTTTASDIKGAKADGGVYVTGFNQVGAKVTWAVNGIQKAGTYRLYVRYGVPGTDADATLEINGKANTQPLNMKNFGNTPEGDWEKGWKTTWANVSLNQGTNTIDIACNDGNQCNALIDQMWLVND
ncbi:CBM35 domain-containing protein [Streptomyces olivochromogenes]|uniref:CBM35 domain-containing protein n=1 Tax=Streptomyces olivochromogenes TaxID=1963 RepID=UPI001F1851C0|nr:CBM35 domain-containing protein [Streptomyces olivochromogenes]MCF3132907.1 carbohydrate-binding protein [Streptomyces olivochromogenes]